MVLYGKKSPRGIDVIGIVPIAELSVLFTRVGGTPCLFRTSVTEEREKILRCTDVLQSGQRRVLVQKVGETTGKLRWII